MKTVIHLLVGGGTGGIEVLCRDYAMYSKHNNIFVFLWSSGVISDEMKKRGNTVVEMNASKKNHIKNIKNLRKIVNQYQADTFVVHHASPILHVYMMAVKRKYEDMATVAYAHGLAEVMYRRDERKGAFFRKMVLKQSLKNADYVVAVSNAVKNSLVQEYKIPEESIMVIHNGVDLARFEAKNLQNTSEELKLIYVGRLIENKGVQLILQAIALCKSECKIHLTIVGDGSYKQRLQDLVEEQELEYQVEFLGNRNDIPDLLHQADIFLHVPLLEEGFGITVIEAMACGEICICSKSGALPEIIQDRFNGFLVDKNDVQGICNCLRTIKSLSQQEINSMKKRAVERARDFSINKFVNKLDVLIGEGRR